MGKIVSIISFTGRVGNLVGAKGPKGKVVLRPYQDSVANPNTPKQIINRTKFLTLQGMGISSKPALFGLAAAAKAAGVSRTNLFFKINYPQVSAALDNLTQKYKGSLDWEHLQFSRGTLPEPIVNTAVVDDGSIMLPLSDTASIPGTSRDDIVYGIVYDTIDCKIIAIEQTTRVDEEIIFHIPSSSHNHKCRVYAFAQGISDTNDRVSYIDYFNGRIVLAEATVAEIESGANYSNTVHCGEVMVQ